MKNSRLTRALTLLVVPALLVPLVASSASAAPKKAKPPAVPTLAQVVKVYPKLKGGQFESQPEGSVQGLRKNCQDGKAIKGAVGREAYYSPKMDPEAEDFGITADAPMISVVAERLPSKKVARTYATSVIKNLPDCFSEDEEGGATTVEKVKVRLGNQSAAFRVWMTDGDTVNAMVVLVARAGKHVVLMSAMSFDGGSPEVPKLAKLAKVALKTARR